MREGKIPLDFCVHTFYFYLRLILNVTFVALSVGISYKCRRVSVSNAVSKLKVLHPLTNTYCGFFEILFKYTHTHTHCMLVH